MNINDSMSDEKLEKNSSIEFFQIPTLKKHFLTLF